MLHPKKKPPTPRSKKMKLNEAIRLLQDAGIDEPVYDAKEIFRRVGGLSPADLISREASTDSDAVISAIERRAKREPLQYIIGEVGFYREVYEVTAACLIPRSDTEILVDYAVKNIPRGARFIDLCTGSGCVAISTLKNTESTTAVALDLSKEALAVARKNAEKNGVSDRIGFINADVLSYEADGEFYAILSNPPYVTSAAYKSLEPEIYFEPRMAFVGGEDGLDFYRSITHAYKDRLAAGGFIAYEIGFDQGEALKSIAASEGMSCAIIKDFSQNDRVAVLKK